MSLTRKNGRSLTVRRNAPIFYLLLFPVFMSFQFTCVHYLIRLCKHIFKLVDICYMFTNTAYTDADLKLVTCKPVIYPKPVVDPCRKSFRIVVVIVVTAYHHKLIAAYPCTYLVIFCRCQNCVCDRFYCNITAVMAKIIIYLFKAVQIADSDKSLIFRI